MCSCWRSAKVEEQRKCMGIVQRKLHALHRVDELLATFYVVTIGKEEVVVVLLRIVGLGELNRHTRQIYICIDCAREVVLVAHGCCQSGVDGELTLPLRTTHAVREREFPLVVFVRPCGIGNLCPAVIGKPRRHADESIAGIDSLPEVAGRIVIQCSTTASAFLVLLHDDLAEVDLQAGRTATEVDEQLSLAEASVFTILLSLYADELNIILASLQRQTTIVDERVVIVALVANLEREATEDRGPRSTQSSHVRRRVVRARCSAGRGGWSSEPATRQRWHRWQ